MYGTLRGHLLAKLVALFKIQDSRQDTVRPLARVTVLSQVNSGWPSDLYSLIMVQVREVAREFSTLDIGTILGLAHLIPEADGCWLVNSCIDWRTFNETS